MDIHFYKTKLKNFKINVGMEEDRTIKVKLKSPNLKWEVGNDSILLVFNGKPEDFIKGLQFAFDSLHMEILIRKQEARLLH